MAGRRNNPETLAERFDDLRADYAATKDSRFRRRRTGLAPLGGGADYHYRNEGDYLKLIELARDMDRNDVIVGALIDRAVINIMQGGFRPDPQTGDPELDAELAKRWTAWANDADRCDVAGELTFPEMESLVLRHVLVDGDVVALASKCGALELVEGHRLRTPRNTKRNVVHGILMNANRRRLEYWLTAEDIDPLRPLVRVSDTKPYPTRDAGGERQIFHVYKPKRISQSRGVTALAPIFDLLGMFEDINFAKLVQSQIVSCFAVFREREPTFRGGGDLQTGPRTVETQYDGSTRIIEGIAPGLEVLGAPGEKLHGFSPNVPNDEFFKHVQMMWTMVSVNLGLPFIIAFMDVSDTTYSGYRGAVDQARLGFRQLQDQMIRRFHRPAWRWWVRQETSHDPALRSRLEAVGENAQSVVWRPPLWPYVDPEKDAKTDALRLGENLTSPSRLHGERGADWAEVVEEIVRDQGVAARSAIAEAADINKTNPEARLDWRELINKVPATTAPANEGDDGEDTDKQRAA